ncbi:MAG: 5'/3'-nucleotidase SurE [Spirochaetaceae bacterium]|jgi:5'-nucleotidase|nr:5'/3'-nucleotidase SurE [Spirochaetaceae bacterium]GMO16751.1 MAG: 5'/3'-nucleotidase SurE [Termitinemataceae bacterium]
MRLLAVNDDGIECDGIIALAQAFEAAGHEVIVVAPDKERSGASHCISLSSGIKIKELKKNFWACSGAPADCVIAALSGGFIPKPDAVISGINAGANLGTDLVYSGTAAGARQAALTGLPGFAFSQTGMFPFDFCAAANWAAAHFKELLALWDKDVFINVNFPPVIHPGFELCVPSQRLYTDHVTVSEAAGGWKKLEFNAFEMQSNDLEGTDGRVCARGIVAVSRILIQPVSKPCGDL